MKVLTVYERFLQDTVTYSSGVRVKHKLSSTHTHTQSSGKLCFFLVQAIQLDGTFCFISFQYLDVNISFPFMVLVKKLPATIPFGNCDAPPFLPRGITMAILPGLYSLRLLCSFSLLIFSATTSEEKTEQ